jgi:hypothetical protein
MDPEISLLDSLKFPGQGDSIYHFVLHAMFIFIASILLSLNKCTLYPFVKRQVGVS